MRNKLYEFGDLFVQSLGKFVGEQRKVANANGITDEDFGKVAKTTFEILGRKQKISVASLNQTIAKK